MEYNNAQKSFIDYINKCREKIRNSFFTKNDRYKIRSYNENGRTSN